MDDDLKKRLDQILVLIRGNEFDEESRRRSIIGRLEAIETALWGPPDHPNGIWGMIREGRVIWRSIAVGITITVGGAIILQVFH